MTTPAADGTDMNVGTPAESGPPTSSESPQTLGVTAGTAIGTDEGGPGTIEAEHVHDEVCKTVMAIRNTTVDGGIEILETFTAQREAQAVNAVLDKLLEHGHGGGNWRRLIEQLRTTGTGGDDVQG